MEYTQRITLLSADNAAGVADLAICPRCGAVVFNEAAHEQFHSRFTAVADDAHYGASMMRPIGGR